MIQRHPLYITFPTFVRIIRVAIKKLFIRRSMISWMIVTPHSWHGQFSLSMKLLTKIQYTLLYTKAIPYTYRIFEIECIPKIMPYGGRDEIWFVSLSKFPQSAKFYILYLSDVNHSNCMKTSKLDYWIFSIVEKQLTTWNRIKQ